MIYNVDSIELKDVTNNYEIEGAKNDGKVIIIYATPDDCWFANSVRIPLFAGNRMYKTLKPLCEAAPDNTLEGEDIPQQIRKIKGGVMMTVALDQKYYQVYSADIKKDGVTIRHKGEPVVDKFGNIKAVSAVDVFCIKRHDPDTGEDTWPIGNPTKRAMDLIHAYYKPVTEAAPASTNNIGTAEDPDAAAREKAKAEKEAQLQAELAALAES